MKLDQERNIAKMKFDIEVISTYNSVDHGYTYIEKFNNNGLKYREGTNWYGVFLAFLSGTFFSVSSALVKAVTTVHPMVLLGIRSIIQMTLMALIAFSNAKNLVGPEGRRLLIVFQGFVGGMTLSLLYYSFRILPLGDAATIIFSSPVIVILLSFLFLKEPCGFLRVVVICALFTGVVFVSQPPFLFQKHKKYSYDMIGYVYALLATLFTALNIVVMRKCLEIHYSVIVFSLSTWSLISAILFYFVLPDKHPSKIVPSDWLSWVLIGLIVVTGVTGQILVTKALKIEGAGKVSVTRSLDIILCYAVQIFYFGEVPTVTSISGSLLILLSIVFMGLEKEFYRLCDFIP